LLEQYFETGRAQMKYLVVYEKSVSGWGAYVPDLPGLGVAGASLDEVKQLIREAMDFHLEGIKEHGDPVPEPSAITEYVSVRSTA
jgi:predicted RNase H-like HicB family nuclease